MDSNNILQSLANLRDALQGIESAKQQVTENVAAYEKVRAQLADTADSVSAIVLEIQTLINDVQLTQSSFSDKLDNVSSLILDELKKKGDNIADQTESLLEALRAKLSKVTAEIGNAVDSATSQLSELTDGKHQELISIVSVVDNKLADAIAVAQKELKSISADFGKSSQQHLVGMERIVDVQLKKLTSGVDDHLLKCSEAEAQIRNHVESIQNQVSSLKRLSDEIEGKIVNALADNETKLSQKMTSLSDAVTTSVADNKKEITKSVAEIKESSEVAQTNLLEQLKSTQETLSAKVDSQAATISSLVKSNKVLTIISIVLMVVLLALSFLK